MNAKSLLRWSYNRFPFFVLVPVRTKRLVVDRHMEVQRFKEELNIIEKEMLVFMKYYKDKMLPSLQIQREKLLNSVKGI